MNIQKRIEEEAYSNTNKREAEIIKTGYKYVLKPELDYAFEQGAHFGFQLCIEMLRSEEAPYFSEGDFNLECAAWLEDLKQQTKENE